MQPLSLSGYFDGQQIHLDEPPPLQPNTRLIITILPLPDPADQWPQLAAQSLAAAYDPEEEEYPLTSIKRTNPDYEGS